MPFLSLVTLSFDLDLQTPPSDGPWTKQVVRMNLAQIRSAVPEIFHTQKTQTDGAKNRTFRSSLRAVKMLVPVDRQYVTQKHRVKRRILTEIR